MDRVIALLRGINIGGRCVAMAALRGGLERAGCRDVVTQVQSGNVVLTPPSDLPEAVDTWLEAVISAIAGFGVRAVVRTPEELARVVERNPYPGATGTRLHVVFHDVAPEAQLLEGLDLDAFAPEHATLVGREIYLHLPEGMGRAALPAALERVAARPPTNRATTRNWNTVLKLVELSGGDPV